MKHIRPFEIIHSKEFLKEPVHNTFKELEEIPTSKIILNKEGSGRSTLLYYIQEKKANTNHPFIRMNFEAAGFCSEENEIFTKAFFQHYWEENFTRKLLWYIKDYYEITYHNNFEKYSDLIKESSKKTNDFINKIAYNETKKLTRMFSPKEITEQILNEFKKSMNVKSIELGIDSFDHINNSDKLTQEILSSYFDLFDKVIITTDDVSLPQEWHKTYLKDNSELYKFQPFSIKYAKDIEVIYNLITKRIYEYNYSLQSKNPSFNPFPIDLFDYENLNLLVTRTNGNIKMILRIINELIMEWEFTDTIAKLDIEKAIQNEEKNELQRKLQFKHAKLHL